MTPQERFAIEHGLRISEVRRFASMADNYKAAMENSMNGDPYPYKFSPAPSDKNENADRWKADALAIANHMTELAKRWGFHHLDFGVGLYPTLQKGESDSHGTVMFPYDN